MQAKIDAQTLMEPGASATVDGGVPVLSACVAEERNRVSGRNWRGGESVRFRP